VSADNGDAPATSVASGPSAAKPATAEASARTRILDAAVDLFAEFGFDRTSTARIAKHAGVPSGLIFYHFSTKIELLLTVVRERAPLVEFSESDLDDLPTGDLQGVITAIWGRLLDRLKEHSAVRNIIFRELASHPLVRQRVREMQDGGTSVIARRLAAVAGIGGDPPPEFDTAARLLVSTAILGSVVRNDVQDAQTADPLALARLITPGLLAAASAGDDPAQSTRSRRRGKK